jgi:hypothetical protein
MEGATPVLQKSCFVGGLALRSGNLEYSSRVSSLLLSPLPLRRLAFQTVELSVFAPGSGGRALFVGESPRVETATSTYPAGVLPLP